MTQDLKQCPFKSGASTVPTRAGADCPVCGACFTEQCRMTPTPSEPIMTKHTDEELNTTQAAVERLAIAIRHPETSLCCTVFGEYLRAVLTDHTRQAERIKELEGAASASHRVLCAMPQDNLSAAFRAEIENAIQAFRALSTTPPAAPSLPADVVELVIKGRAMFDTFHGYGGHASCAQVISEFDKALEAFSARVPYEDDPTAPAVAEQTDREG